MDRRIFLGGALSLASTQLNAQKLEPPVLPRQPNIPKPPAPNASFRPLLAARVIPPAPTGQFLIIDDFGAVGEAGFSSVAEFENSAFAPDAPDHLHAAVSLFFLNGGSRIISLSVDGSSASSIASAISQAESTSPRQIDFISAPIAARSASADAALIYAQCLKFAKLENAILLLDPPLQTGAANDVAALKRWVTQIAMQDFDAAIYAPGLTMATASSIVAPSAAIAGIAARIGDTRGIWKAPAGTDASVRAAQPVTNYTEADSTAATPDGINLIRTLNSAGPVVWGARTRSADPEWRYVPVRRLALHLEKSIVPGLSWTSSFQNSEPLWAAVRGSINGFMEGLFRKGAFQGEKQSDAHFVKCDRSTMTQNDISSGRLIAQVGFAPLRPAEFVVRSYEWQTR